MISAAASAGGDSAAFCVLPDGSTAFILSDGMGKGEKAAEESGIAVARLKKLLKNGQPVSAAIKTLNKMMVERSGEEENFATIDLTVIDKKTGKGRFYKMGASASFVVRKGRVRRIQRPALPVGILPAVRSSCVTVCLEPGDIVVMVSDGVTEADRNDLSCMWLRDLLKNVSTAENIGPRIMAESIAAEAKARYGCRERDDLTALVAMIQ